jgi:hypothetical protein
VDAGSTRVHPNGFDAITDATIVLKVVTSAIGLVSFLVERLVSLLCTKSALFVLFSTLGRLLGETGFVVVILNFE